MFFFVHSQTVQKKKNRPTNRKKGSQKERQTVKETDRQTDRETDRQIIIIVKKKYNFSQRIKKEFIIYPYVNSHFLFPL